MEKTLNEDGIFIGISCGFFDKIRKAVFAGAAASFDVFFCRIRYAVQNGSIKGICMIPDFQRAVRISVTTPAKAEDLTGGGRRLAVLLQSEAFDSYHPAVIKAYGRNWLVVDLIYMFRQVREFTCTSLQTGGCI